jgi:antitoxin MazE
MIEVVLNLKRWGNSLGMRLPSVIAKAAHLHLDQRVRLVVEDGNVIVTPLSDTGLTLEQRLALFDPEKHGGEVLQTNELVGAEKL